MTDEPRVVHPDGAETFRTPQGEDVTVLARGDDPGESFDLLSFTVPEDPGAVPMHVHHENDEVFYVLEGTLRLQVAGDRFTLEPGSYAYGPRGVPHGYRNVGDGPVEFLVLYTPGNFVSFAEELAALGPLDLDDESDLERVVPVFESYGLEMIGPPPEG